MLRKTGPRCITLSDGVIPPLWLVQTMNLSNSLLSRVEDLAEFLGLLDGEGGSGLRVSELLE